MLPPLVLNTDSSRYKANVVTTMLQSLLLMLKLQYTDITHIAKYNYFNVYKTFSVIVNNSYLWLHFSQNIFYSLYKEPDCLTLFYYYVTFILLLLYPLYTRRFFINESQDNCYGSVNGNVNREKRKNCITDM